MHNKLKSTEESLVEKNSFFSINFRDVLPIPPSFKHGFEGKEFGIPKYFPFDHSETQWILNMYRNQDWERLQRLASVNPYYFSNTYYQIPDNPDPKFGRPMLNDRVVMYLTPFALALYLNCSSVVNNLLVFRDQRRKKIIDINQPLFVTNVYIKSNERFNDLLQISCSCILILRESMDCIPPMLIHGKWRPLKPFTFFYRRPFKICRFVYKDIIDYALSIIISKTSLKLPLLLQNFMDCVNGEFSLLYYEQIISRYKKQKIEEWVSIPRRLLRFAFYFDKDMRLTCQIIRCIQVFQQHSFFFGPTQSCFEISYKQRIQMLECNFDSKIGDPDTSKVVLDQDCCFSLLFGLMMHSHSFKHDTIKEKLIGIIASVAKDTMWLLHFLIKKPIELSKYFSSLIEKVGYIPEYIFIQIKFVIMKQLETNIIPIYSIRDLNVRPNENIPVDVAVSQFAHMNVDTLGYFHPEIILENCSNQVISGSESCDDTENSDNSNEDELEMLIKKQIDQQQDTEESDNGDITGDVIKLLQNDYKFN